MKSYSHLDTSLNFNNQSESQRQPLKTEFEEFEKTQQLTQGKQQQLEKLLNELLTLNATRKKQLQNVKAKVKPQTFRISTTEQSRQSVTNVNEIQDNENPYIQEMEASQQLMVNLGQLQHSIAMKKQAQQPLKAQLQQYTVQEKQARREQQLAMHELDQIHTSISELKTQLQRLKYERRQYVDFVSNQQLRVADGMQSTLSVYQETMEQVEAKRSEIKRQKLHVTELFQVELQKLEQVNEQKMTLLKFATIMQLYQYCNDQSSDIGYNIQIEESEEETIDVSDDSIQSNEVNSIFQTQINVKGKKTKKIIKKKSKQITIPLEVLLSARLEENIKIIIQFIIEQYRQQIQQQKSYMAEHLNLEELQVEQKEVLKELDHKYDYLEGGEQRLFRSSEPQIDNFASNLITYNIAKTSIGSDLECLKQQDKQTQIELLFFSLNTRAHSFLTRICSSIWFIQSKYQKVSISLVNAIQNAQLTQTLIKQDISNNELQLYPKLSLLVQQNHMTRLYCDSAILAQFKSTFDEVNDQVLTQNFSILCQLCINKISYESQFIYEQIAIIYNLMQDEINNHYSNDRVRPKKLSYLQDNPSQVQISCTAAAKKLQEYADSKFNDITSGRRNNKKSLMAEGALRLIMNPQDNSLNEDNIDDLYYATKQQIEKLRTKDSQVTQSIKTKASLLYDSTQNSAMQDMVRQNRMFTQQLKRLQSDITLPSANASSLRILIEKDKRNLEALTRASRAPSSIQGQMTTQRPMTQEKNELRVPQLRATTSSINYKRPIAGCLSIEGIWCKNIKILITIMNKIADTLSQGNQQKELVERIRLDNKQTIDEVISAVSGVMRSNSDPEKCYFGMRLIKQGIDTNNVRFRQQVFKELMPMIYQVSIHKIHEQNDNKGVDYFKPNTSNHVRKIGNSYVRLCLDCVRVWGIWYPEYKQYLEKLNQLNGYLPPIWFYSEQQLEDRIPKMSQITPNGDVQANDQIAALMQELHYQLSHNEEECKSVKHQLEIINKEFENLLVQEVNDQQLEDFILTYQDYTEQTINYRQFRNHFIKQIPDQHQQFNQQFDRIDTYAPYSQISDNLLDKSISSIENQNQLDDNHQQNEIHNLKEQLLYLQSSYQNEMEILKDENSHLRQQQQHLEQMTYKLEIITDENTKLRYEINELNQHNHRELLQQVIDLQEQLQQQQHISSTQIANKHNNSQQEAELIEQQKKHIEQLQVYNEELQLQLQNQGQLQYEFEEIQNLKIENSLLQEQLKQHKHHGMNADQKLQVEMDQQKQKYHRLSAAYDTVLEENNKLKKQIRLLSLDLSQTKQSNQEIEQAISEDKLTVQFCNFRESDLWSDEEEVYTPVVSSIIDIAELIYPYKNAIDYFQHTGKKNYKGIQIARMNIPANLNQQNTLLLKKASRKQRSLLFVNNKIQVRQRTQLLNDFGDVYVSTTLCIKNTDLVSCQVALAHDAKEKNIWYKNSNKSPMVRECPNIVIGPAQHIIVEYIRKLDQSIRISEISLSINLIKSTMILPITMLQHLKFIRCDRGLFKKQYKQASHIYKTNVNKIGDNAALISIANQGVHLNSTKQSDIDRGICASKYGLSGVFNEQQIQFVLVIRPTSEFVVMGFSQDANRQLLQNILAIFEFIFT